MTHKIWPQITLIVIYAMAFVVALFQHGKEKEGRYNVFTHLISSAIGIWLLIEGGFFDNL